MEEINEEDFHTAVLVFAHFIGIDIENEQHLLYIAEDALGKRGLPAGWELGIGEDANKGIPYFFNTETSQSVWNHPREAVFMRKVKEEKEKDTKKKEKDATKPAKPTPKKPERKAATKTEGSNDKKASSSSSSSSSSGGGEGGDDIIEVEDFDDADAVTMLEEDTPKKPIKKSSSNGGFGMSRDDLLKESDNDNRNDSPKPARPAKSGSSKLAEKKDTWASAGSSSGSGAASSRTGGLKSVEGPPVPSRAAKPNRATDNDRPRPNTSAGTTGGGRDRDGGPGARDRPASSAGERGGGGAAGQRPRTSDDRDRVAARDKERERERERTKEQRDKARDREREDELRARDREREREARDRDREKERERERERDMGKELDSRVAAERRRTDEERRRALHFEDEVEVMRDKLRDMEGTVAEERERRRKIEEKLTSAQGDYDSRLRDTVDSWEERLRRTRDEVETDMREKMKNVERRAADDVEEARAELKTAKAKQAEAEREAETMRRKMGMGKEDGKAEAHEEMTRLRVELETAGDIQRVHATEMRHLREENVELGSKLASALQASQVAVAEAEMAKAQASNIVAEGQSSHTALVQATNRIQELDTELARMKGELLLQKKEAEAAQNEMAKLRGKEGSHTEKINLAEAEVRKARVGAQTEVMRLQSRVQELEQTNDIITQQLDNAGTDQTKAVRDVERTLDKALFDMTRVQDNLRAEEAKCEAGVQRIIALEKQLLQQQDVVYKREREVKEHQTKSEQAEARVDEVAQSFAKEVKAAQAELADAKKALQALKIAHQKEIDAIKAEVQQKLPELSAQAAAHMEKQFQQRLEDEATSIRRRFELSEERYKREILDVQTAYAEREARSRVAVADDRAELEHVKAQNGKLQRQVEELEAQTDELQQTMKAKSRALLLADKERYIQAVDASVEGLPPPPSHHLSQQQQQQQQQQHSLDRDDSQVTDKAVMELQQQLAMMKGQLGAALERTMNTESRAAHVPFSITKSAYSAHRPHQQVTFSPESLFMSPDAKSVAAALSAGDTIRPEKSAVRFASEGGDNYMDGGMQDYTYMQSPAPNNKSAVDRSYAAYGDAAVPTPMPMPTQPAATATDYAQSEAKEGPASSAGAGADENDIGIDDPQFDGIQDGGFHEGYWKARYHKAKAQSSTQGYR